MEGFFSKKDTQSISRPAGKTLSCVSCGLYKGADSPKMTPYGKGRKKILIIGEAPGAHEDRKGMPWQGRTGKLLQSTLDDLEIDLFDDCVSVNAVNCRPPDNRTPSSYEVDCCRTIILSDVIKKTKPRMILLLGTSALQSFIGPRWQKDLGGITKWRGFIIPDQDYQCFIAPTYHPSYVERSEREVETIWREDLKRAIRMAKSPFPAFPTPDIHYIKDLSILRQFGGVPEVSFDYETTGLKPHAKGHRIVCASVAVDREKVFTFMMPNTRKERLPFIELLISNTIGKMAHNMKFEEIWTRNRLRVGIKNWQWDSMLAAHQLDNRPGITSLKFQVYINFGVVDYSSEITPFFKGTSNGGNIINRINELLEKPGGKKKLLKYCALDSHYQFLLADRQKELIGFNYLPF